MYLITRFDRGNNTIPPEELHFIAIIPTFNYFFVFLNAEFMKRFYDLNKTKKRRFLSINLFLSCYL